MPDPPAYLDISCNGLNEEQITRVKEIVSNSEFYVDEQMDVTKREHIIHISPFEKNETNESAVVQLKNKMGSEFSDCNNSLDRNRSDPSHYGDFGYRIQIGESSDAPEWTEITHGDKEEVPTEQNFEELEEFNERLNSSISETTNEPAPGTIDEWEMWYPCPECQSMELIQAAENRSQQRATEDGSWGGQEKTLETYNYIECGDCGAVLTEWKGG